MKKKLNKIVSTTMALTMVSSLSITQLVFANENTNSDVEKNAIYNKNSRYGNLEDLSIQQLTEIRNNEIDKNLEGLNEFGKESVQDCKNRILNSDFGLVAFINNNYKSLTEKDKLIRQIKLIEYLNSINEIMDPSGEYFNAVNEDYQLSEYLLKNGKDSNTVSYENLKFLSNNLEDISNFIDYDIKDVIEHIDPSIKPSLSQEQKSSLNNTLKNISSDNDINPDIKNKIRNLQNESDEKSDLNSISPLATSSSYRQNALSYAKKHGYTNGYYGSTNRKNNAPSPYYNFQKDGYGDCANFVSQCLKAGGVSFWTNNNPWYYYSVSNRAPSWAGAREFKLHWMKRVDYQTLTVSNSLSFLRPATPVSICRSNGVAYHSLITTDKHSNGYNFSYAAHSDEGKRTNLLEKLKGKLISYYKVYW